MDDPYKEEIMTELRRQLQQEMALAGFARKTQEAYLQALGSLVRHAGAPADLTDGDLRRYFIHLVDDRKLARATVKVHLCGLSFLYRRVLGRTFSIGKDILPRKEKRLPVVLTRGEVGQLLDLVRQRAHRTALSTIYACGLRLSEVLALTPENIDSHRMVIWVRGSKGARDRVVPLPQRTLALLREHWRMHRPKHVLFESRRKVGHPLHPTVLQRTFKAVVRKSGIRKAATVHTLRHSYATHLLDSGVHLRVIQEVLGHSSPKTTARYLHLTGETIAHAHAVVDALARDL
jgi:integrase/recombinase XerD